MNDDLCIRQTLPALIASYNKAVAEVKEGYLLLETAKNRLSASFLSGQNYYFNINARGGYGSQVGEKAALEDIKKLKKDAWRALVDRLELRRVLSVKRAEELEKQLSDPKFELPDVTEANVLALFEESLATAQERAQEKIVEVYEWLHPRGGSKRYKTNERWHLGRKAIIYAVEQYCGRYRVRYHYQQEITALDSAFHLLDGRGIVGSHYGPLYDAIEKSGESGAGETEFFRFSCHKNGNLHVEFQRSDLVDRLNTIAADGKSIGGD